MSFEVGFDFTTDSSGFITGVAEAVKAQQMLNDEVKDFEKQSKDTFKTSTDEVASFNDELLKGTKQTTKFHEETKKLPKVKNAVQELKAEIKRYTSEAAKAGEGTKEWYENIAKAGELKDELKALNDAVRATSDNYRENFAKAAGESINIVARGYEGLTAVQTLAGENAEAFEQTLLKLQSLNALANITREFGGLDGKIREIRLGFKPLTDLYVKGNDAVKSFFKEGKDGADSLSGSNKSLFSTLSTGIKSFVKSARDGFKSLWATISANPLGVILVLFGTLVTTLVLLKDKIKPIGQLFEFLGNVVNKLIYPFQRLAELMHLIADENERRLEATIKNSEAEVQAITDSYNAQIAIAEANERRTAELEKQKFNATRDRIEKTIKALQELEKINGKLNKEQKEQYEATMKELENIDTERTVFLAKESVARKKFEEQQADAIANIQISRIKDDEAREKAFAKKRYEDDLLAAAQRASVFYDSVTEIYDKSLPEFKALEERYQKELYDISKKYSDKRAEDAKKEKERLEALEKDLLNSLLDLRKRSDQADLSRLQGEERIRMETKFANQDLAILRDAIYKKGLLTDKNFKFTAEQEELFNNLQRQIYIDETQKLIQLQVERDNALAKAKAETAKANLDSIKSLESIDLLGVDAFEKPKNLSDVEFEESKQRAKLEIQKKYAELQFKLTQATLAAQREELVKGYNGELQIIGFGEDAETKLKRDAVIKRLNLTEDQFIQQQSATEAAYKAQLAGINNQLAKLNAQKPFSLAKVLGISDNDLKNLQSAISSIQETFDTIIGDLIAKQDLQIAASQKKQSEYEKEITELENKIKSEDDLNNQGKANNRSRILAEIEDKKRQQEAEKALAEKALEEKKKLQKEKLVLDSIAQASNLVTAASEIYASTASGGPVGVAIGTVAIAAMIAAFAASKISAAKAIDAQTLDSQNFKDGVIDLKGPGTETSDSIPANLSKGESVFTAKQTRENLKLFKGIFNEDKRLMHEGVLDLIKGKGISLIPEISEGLLQRKETIRTNQINNYAVADNKAMEKELSNMNSKFEALLKEQKNKTFVDGKGNLVKQIGSHQIVIRK